MFPFPTLSSRSRWWLLLAALTGVYVLAGKLGLSVAFLNASASPVWPPTGIALAATLGLGYRVWPAIFAGAFIVNVTTTGSVATSLGIAVGNTLEALLGAALVNRFAGGRAVFERAQTIFTFAMLAGLLSTAVSATIGVTTLALAGHALWADYGAIWLTWWLGDAAGDLVIAPPLLLWWTKRDVRWDTRRWVEGALLLLSLLVAAGGVFTAAILEDFAFLCLPPLVWAAFRFGQREVATAIALLSLTATWATLHGSGPFVMATQNASLLVLQAFMATITLMTLPIGALIAERRHAEAERVRLLEQEQAARIRAQAAEARFAVLGEIARSITSSLDLEAVLQRVVDGARELCRSDLAALLLREETTGIMTPRYRAWRPGSPNDDAGGVEAARRAAEQVLVTRRPLRIEDDRRGAGDGADAVVSLMVVPILIQGRVEGLLYVDHRTPRPFTDQDEEICGRLAAHAAIAIQNAHLFAGEQAARGEAETANHAKDRFLAVLSHELRTPLNAIMGWVRILRRRRLDEAQQAHALEVVERNTVLAAQLINDLLDISRIVAGKLQFDRDPVDLVPLLHDVLEAARSEADAKGVALVAQLDPDAGHVLGDQGRLLQVVTNLVSNAVKFTPAGGRVGVTLVRTDTSARLMVSDTGEGIAPEDLPHIFEAFRQADTTSTRQHQGLGLGLAIARQLVERHGGSITAQSAGKGQGATFTVTLHIVAIVGGRTGRGPAGEPRPEGHRPRPVLAGLRVLVVDDDGDARELVGLALQQAGATVDLAASVAEALQALDTRPVDMLVSDIAMPRADGYALISAVRAIERERGGKTLRAMALTAHADAETRKRAFALGFEAYATKPVNPDVLIDMLASLRPPPPRPGAQR
jgi:signal transduction histidine kinase/integral membrane sensor domain MASE1/CheY-like chemotaxis protein